MQSAIFVCMDAPSGVGVGVVGIDVDVDDGAGASDGGASSQLPRITLQHVLPRGAAYFAVEHSPVQTGVV